MRFAIVSLLCLSLLFTGCISNESKKVQEQNHTQAGDNHDSISIVGRAKMEVSLQTGDDKDPKNYGWNDEALQHLAVFQSLLSTDVEAARAEITKIAQIRSGAHPLADEWSKLFFRLYRDRKGSALDMRRYWELEMQLLSDVNAEAYAEGIRDYQLGLKQINAMIEIMESRGDDPKTVEGDFNFDFSSYLKGK